jgi:hypothetical protein
MGVILPAEPKLVSLQHGGRGHRGVQHPAKLEPKWLR